MQPEAGNRTPTRFLILAQLLHLRTACRRVTESVVVTVSSPGARQAARSRV